MDSNLRFPDRSAPVFETASPVLHLGLAVSRPGTESSNPSPSQSAANLTFGANPIDDRRGLIGVDQVAIETHGLHRRLKRHGVLRGTRRAEVIRDAADGNDQRVVTERPRRRDLKHCGMTVRSLSIFRLHLSIQCSRLRVLRRNITNCRSLSSSTRRERSRPWRAARRRRRQDDPRTLSAQDSQC
jgi:hypothetical protein